MHVASANTAAATELCIRTLRRYAGLPLELVVGDSGSTDGSVQMLRRLEARGCLTLQLGAPGRAHAAWLDEWLATCDLPYAVFVDSDVEFLRPGWLAELVSAARSAGAALVFAELLAGNPHYVHPLTGEEARLAPRPSPWLLLADVKRIRGLGVSMGYDWDADPTAPGGVVSYDVGARLAQAVRRAGLTALELPPSFRRTYRHYGGLSWKSPRGLKGLGQLRKRLRVQLRLRLVRLRQDAVRAQRRRQCPVR